MDAGSDDEARVAQDRLTLIQEGDGSLQTVDQEDSEVEAKADLPSDDGDDGGAEGADCHDDGSAWNYRYARPTVQTNVSRTCVGDKGRNEYDQLKTKFLGRFRVDDLHDITVDMLRCELDPQTSIFGRTLFDLISGNEETGVVDVTMYWAFIVRRLRLMSLRVSSSMTEHPVFGKVYNRVVGGPINHDGFRRLLGNIDSPYVATLVISAFP